MKPSYMDAAEELANKNVSVGLDVFRYLRNGTDLGWVMSDSLRGLVRPEKMGGEIL